MSLYVYPHEYVFIHRCICMYKHTHYIHAGIHTFVCMYICMHVCRQTYMGICV